MGSLSKEHKRFDPQFCGRAIKIAAAACAMVVLGEIVLLETVDSSGTRCPGWLIAGGNGTSRTIWGFVPIVALWALWICFCAVRWDWFARRTIDRLASYEQALERGGAGSLTDAWRQYNARVARDLHLNWLFVAVMIGSVFFTAMPLLVIAAKCV